MNENINDPRLTAPKPAFSVSVPRDFYFADQGMLLRDWFAGQALAGLCANPGGPFQANPQNGWSIVNCTTEDVARVAHDLADAMLKARDEA